MITVKIVLDNIDYESVIQAVKRETKHSFLENIGLSIASFFSKRFISQKTKDKFIVSYCEKNKATIIGELLELANKNGVVLSIKDFDVE